MKIECEVIQDILPLYAEDIVSDESRKLIESHLKDCSDCQQELAAMQNEDEIPLDINSNGLKLVKEKLFKDKFKSVIFSILLTLIISITGINYLTKPNYLSYSKDSVTIVERANGELTVNFDQQVANYRVEKELAEDGLSFIYYISTWDSIWSQLANNKPVETLLLNPENENIMSIYYVSANQTENQLLYGIDLAENGGMITLPRLLLGGYVRLALLLTALFLVLLFIANKLKKDQRLIRYLLIAPISYIIATFCIKGWNTFSYAATRDFLIILLIAIPIYGVLFLSLDFYQQWKERR